MAPIVDVHDIEGDGGARVELDEDLFGVTPNVAVLHQVVTAQLAAARRGTQSTKTRAEVRGGGAKPFKQKGTGRARQGSERAPQFTGGGVALGPKPRSYRQRTPRKMIALALRSALSDRAAQGRIAVVEEWSFDRPSTRAAIAALSGLGVSGRILVVLDRDNEIAFKSFRNIPEVQSILVGELNAYDILINDWVVFTRATLPGRASELAALAASEPATAEVGEGSAEPEAEAAALSPSEESDEGEDEE